MQASHGVLLRSGDARRRTCTVSNCRARIQLWPKWRYAEPSSRSRGPSPPLTDCLSIVCPASTEIFTELVNHAGCSAMDAGEIARRRRKLAMGAPPLQRSIDDFTKKAAHAIARRMARRMARRKFGAAAAAAAAAAVAAPPPPPPPPPPVLYLLSRKENKTMALPLATLPLRQEKYRGRM